MSPKIKKIDKNRNFVAVIYLQKITNVFIWLYIIALKRCFFYLIFFISLSSIRADSMV